MIQTPASGPFSPVTCPPMPWAEISMLAARTAPPCSSANALTPVAINRFNFMSRSPMMRHSLNRPCLRRLWHTVGHGGYFDQSLLLVEGLGAKPFASHMVKTRARRGRLDAEDRGAARVQFQSAISIAATHRSNPLPQVLS